MEKYISDNIAATATDKPVLGGSWYVIAVEINPAAKTGMVIYEDGHIQSSAAFSYIFDQTKNTVSIQNFTLKK